MNFLSYDLWLCSVNKCPDSYAAKFNFNKILQFFSNPPVISYPPVLSHFGATEKGLLNKISTPKTNNRLVIPLSINISPLQSFQPSQPFAEALNIFNPTKVWFTPSCPGLFPPCHLFSLWNLCCVSFFLTLPCPPVQFKSHFHFTSSGLHDITRTSPFLFQLFLCVLRSSPEIIIKLNHSCS